MPTLTVATLNLHRRQHRWRERRHLVVSQLIDMSPDLIGLQEVDRLGRQGTWLHNQINHRLTGTAHRPYHLVQQWRSHPLHSFQGLAILSRLPLISHDAVSLGYEGHVALRANVALPSGQTLDFVTVHLYAPSHAHEARQEQVMLLTGWLNSPGHVPLRVIAGDFNELPDGPAIRQMKHTYRSAYATCYGREPLATFPTALVPHSDGWTGCLDYIFISSGIKSLESRLVFDEPAVEDDTLYPSDHVGILATLQIDRK